MHGQIKSCIAIDERPGDHQPREHPVAHEQAEEHGDAERVGRMGREETVVEPAPVVDDMHGIHPFRIIAWPRPGDSRFHQSLGDKLRDQEAQGATSHDQTNLRHGLIVLDHKIEQGNIQRYPRHPGGERDHQRVEKHGVMAVEHAEQLPVYLYHRLQVHGQQVRFPRFSRLQPIPRGRRQGAPHASP